MKGLWSVLLLSIIFFSCQNEKVNPNYKADALDPIFLHRSVDRLTDVIVHDIFSPPVASRNYVYPCIAAFEVLASKNTAYKSLTGQLRDLNQVPKPEAGKDYAMGVASIQAFLETSKHFVFSVPKLEEFQNEVQAEFQAIGIPKEVYQRSITYGDAMAKAIIEWANGDNYNETRSFPKYSISEDPSRWAPTPPDYMDGIEPHWNKIRPLVLDSATQFMPLPPTEFNLEEGSQFHKELMEVYDAVANAEKEHIEIAKFWDCNPFVSNVKGHIMFATKKISPGGHWMGITQIASRNEGSDIYETAQAYTMVAISLFDAFISCWDEKYRSSLIRPETVINQHFDQEWLPLLQTPPFPEHTSGHSVISSASAVALTNLYGQGFSFIDSTEVKYGLPPRSFASFYAASEEAAISRLYGGIHYRPAIEYGVDQGRKVGNFIVENVKLKD